MTTFTQTTCLGAPIGSNASLEEIQGHIRAFLEQHIVDEGSNYEVEAKFGRFIDKNTNERISLPVMNSCVLTPGNWYRFEAEVSIEQHRHLNRLINERFQKDNAAWRYQHLRTVDTIYSLGGYQGRKVRVSRDASTNVIVASIEKRRISDLAIHIPSSSFDIRLSINTETKVQINENDLVSARKETERYKDRISYKFDRFLQIDLTQVKQRQGYGMEEVKHEVELELISTEHVNAVPELPLIFLCNILDLATNTKSSH